MSFWPILWLILFNSNRGWGSKDGEDGFKSSPTLPNIILFITDDQDSLLGSMEFMPRTLKFLRKRGAEFENAFVSTPMCCPSRTTILTGLYAHNHNVMTNNLNCAGLEWRSKFEKSTFGVHLRNAGYQTAYFGKYLNEYDGSYVPPSWEEWVGLIRNSRFYNYTVNRNGVKEKHGFDYYDDYFTDLITNGTLELLKKREVKRENRPFLIVISYPAPHGPEDPAPQFSGMFEDIDTHRTASWNYAPNPDKQWILQRTGKMEPTHVFFTDLLHRRRLQTLQSVDDSVHQIMNYLRSTNQLQNTYTMYTSDHGYHLGQFGLIKGKSMPYEFDIKVPFFIRGPNIHKGIIKKEPVLNIDIAPTILHMANVTVPSDMNGESILKTFDNEFKWRETVLIERGKMPRLKKVGERLKKQKERFNKYLLLSRQCSKAKYSAPCKPKQEWVCLRNSVNRWRIVKCRQSKQNKQCKCREKRDISSFQLTNILPEDISKHSESQLHKWEDQFLAEAFEELLAESGEWYQGILEVPDKDEVSNIELKTSDRSSQRKRRQLNEIKLEIIDGDTNDHVNHNDDFDANGNIQKLNVGIDNGENIENGYMGKINHQVGNNARTLPKDEDEIDRLCVFKARKWCDLPRNITRKLWNKRKNRVDMKIQKLKDRILAVKDLRKALRQNKPSLGEAYDGLVEMDTVEKCDCNQGSKHPLRTSFLSSNRTSKNCTVLQMNCFEHSDSHWKTEPKWPSELGSFCFCQNSNNNTYWCLRTVNSTHNFLYCEFVTGFLSFYDLNVDPNQLTNNIFEVEPDRLAQLNDQLMNLKSCTNNKDCEHYSSLNWYNRITGTMNDTLIDNDRIT
ncbi:unnamed protein product [Bursaphelenchus okinawaensis]|uniref:Sulfatase N-terminal domain-containing protein n=1 Tax=Bursaphelenchus okinawaensis TaxID=465554 RepID=A0A811LMV7_9BILA|nr:unnamed protein product [Bursaphelenchus okinawaensis]CAG9124473.1 unnamed protein product [Bursaphelenchus okinawaensis]